LKPRIAIVTSLVDFSPAYSLTGIILDQARMFKKHGYEYTLFCLRNFHGDDKGIPEREGLNVEYSLPQTTLIDYQPTQTPRQTSDKEMGFEDQAEAHLNGRDEAKGYLHVLENYDTIITHDLMFLGWHLPQNKALRACIDKWPEKNWLHWIHSGPSQKSSNAVYPTTLRYSAAPHSTYVFLNETQKLDCALMLGTTRDNIAVVYNPKDPREVFGFCDDTIEMIERYGLFTHDLLQVYPFSTTRWTDKGIKHLMRLVAEWKKQGILARVVFVNAHCNSKGDKKYTDGMEAYAQKMGLELDKDIIFTYRFADQTNRRQWRYSVPFRVIRELGMISNLFVFPSASECCSLIQAEASIGNKFMVLNRDFAPMMEFCTNNVLNFEFSKNNPDDLSAEYYMCVAREIWAEFKTESAMVNGTKARCQTYNKDHIFKTQLEPLVWKKYKPRERGAKSPTKEAVSATANDCRLFPEIGTKCSIWGSCTEEARANCEKQAGRCMMTDEELA
jgi:hypothetical protein